MRLLKFFGLISIVVLCACDKRTSDEKEVYGVINSRFVTGSDIERYFSVSQDDLKKLTREEKQKYFQRITDIFILEHEAKRINLTENSILGFFDEINPGSVSKAETKDFVERFPGLKKINQVELTKLIRTDRLDRAKLKYRAELRKRSTVKSFIDQTESGL